MKSIEKDLENNSGYRFPFEGEKHLCTIVELPYRKDTWRLNALPAREEFKNVIQAISKYELVVVAIDPSIDYKTVGEFQNENTHILRIPYNDSWARDNSPIFLINDETNLLCGVDFAFNAWGGDYNGLYDNWEKDNRFSREILLDLMIPRYDQKDFILEGGSVHTDGEGTLLVTECCLLSPGRNKDLSKEEIEERLKKSLNIEKVLWLPYGIYEDETDGHIDNIACFAKPGVVLLSWCDDENDPQYELCKKDYDYLSSVVDAKGRKLEIIKVQLPKPLYLTDEEASGIENEDTAIERKGGRRLAASYVNFYLGEKFVILPQFDVDEDALALDQFKEIFPDREIIPVYSREILLGGGNIHCITKQVPISPLYYIKEKEEARKR